MLLSYNEFINENDSWVGNAYSGSEGCRNWGSKDINITDALNDILKIEGKYLNWNGWQKATKEDLDRMAPTWEEFKNNRNQYENKWECQMEYHLMDNIKNIPLRNVIFAEEKTGRSGALKWEDYCDFKIVDGPNKNILYIENTQKGSPDAYKFKKLGDFLDLLRNSGKRSVSISYIKEDKKIKINSILIDFIYRRGGDFQRNGFDDFNLVFIKVK